MAAQCVSKVELFFRCNKLEDHDTLSKSDPFLVLYSHGAKGKIECGRTEVVKDNLNPVFQKSMIVDYFFEMKQTFSVSVTDYDGAGKKGDALGSCEFVLGSVLGSRGSTKTFPLQGHKGTVTITAVETGHNNDLLEIVFAGTKMKKMDTFGKSDCYFHLSRVLPNGSKTELYKSEIKKNSLEPRWGPCPNFSIAKLCSGNLTDRCLMFDCWDYDTIGSDDAMGYFMCSVQELIDAGKSRTAFELKKDSGKKYGNILVSRCNVIKVPTFIDYLKGGLQINLAVSIDFTGSNGNPTHPASLHFINPTAPNQYETAIMSVGEILSYYDADKQFPAFGFGAKLPDGNVSHYFHLNLQQNPYVLGVPGILDAYRGCLHRVTLYGPTNFAPTITSISQASRQAPGVYTVLLIITDGEITDMDATIGAIVNADDAPLSIVIVGVGEADFDNMNTLDGDDAQLRFRGKVSRRDIVQFVPFREFKNKPPEMLSAEVLREIPDQVVRWAQLTKFKLPPS